MLAKTHLFLTESTKHNAEHGVCVREEKEIREMTKMDKPRKYMRVREAFSTTAAVGHSCDFKQFREEIV